MIQVSAERQRQLAYTGIKASELELLAKLRPVFQQVVAEVVDRFYERVQQEPYLQSIISRFSTIERLKETQRDYWLSLTDGKIDDAFIANRIRIGHVHSRIGLSTDWYLGTYMIYLDLAAQVLEQAVPERWREVVFVLTKLFNLDSQLVLEAYEQKEKQQLQQLNDEQEHLLATVTQAVQELASMIVELDASTQAIAESAAAAAQSQDQSDQMLSALSGELEEITSVGALIRGISDQTHLLGLNAAIEAARAGEHGRGFEVVANEVRKLAASSRNALEEIQDKLAAVEEKLQQVKQESANSNMQSRQQAASSQELASFVQMIDRVTKDLEQLQLRGSYT